MPNHTITINRVLNGFLVNVGCQNVVFESRERLLVELDGYLKSPCATEKHYRENSIHKFLLDAPQVPTPCREPDGCGVEPRSHSIYTDPQRT